LLEDFGIPMLQLFRLLAYLNFKAIGQRTQSLLTFTQCLVVLLLLGNVTPPRWYKRLPTLVKRPSRPKPLRAAKSQQKGLPVWVAPARAIRGKMNSRSNHDCALWNTKKNTITLKQPNA